MGWWPLASNNSGLLFLRNVITEPANNSHWHSIRHTIKYNSRRHQVLKAISHGRVDLLEQHLKKGWPVDAIVDNQGKYSALTLACLLDNLEMVHLLDMYGADLSKPQGKLGFSPLMTAVERWNVRIVDYLLERGVDPEARDIYGFTAGEKAKLRQLKTISSMI
jgi:ankyrin repeat protein